MLLYTILPFQLIYKKILRPGKDCEASDLQDWEGQTSCAKNDNASVTHGTECRFKPATLDQTFVAKCVDGQWIRGETRSGNVAFFSPTGQEYPFLQVSEIFLSRPAISA